MMKLVTATCKKNINDLHAELYHPSESITHATTKAMGILVTSVFKPCEDCIWGKAKQQGVSKKDITWSKIFEERLFFNISSLSTPTFGNDKHWLLVLDDSSNYIWFLFKREP